MLYLVQVIAYTGILYIVYMLLLRNRPMHGFNRAYLLSIILLPVIIPFIKLSSLTTYFEKNTVMNMRLPEVSVGGAYEQQVVNNTINWVLVAYVAITVLMLVLFVRKWILLRRVIGRSTAIQETGYTLLLNTKHGPGSWGRYILLPDEQIHETIVQHEAAHVHLHHSRDILLINLVQCLFWPNIFLQAIKKELKQVHEFQADAAVGMDRQQYSELLLSNVFNTCTLPLTHSFNIHPIKRRIMMLKKRSSKPIALTIGLVAVIATSALLFNMVALQSCNKKEFVVLRGEELNGLSKMPKMPDAIQWNEYIGSHLKYPEEAKKKGLEGRATVRFVIDENGRIVNPEVIKSTDSMFSKAALDVMYGMPKWEPAEKSGRKVAVEFIQPFSFKLGNEKNPATTVIMSNPGGEGQPGTGEITNSKATKVTSIETDDNKKKE